MHIAKYLKRKKMTKTEFARIVRVDQTAVVRYCSGERIPAPDIMRRIYKATRGKVDANSFYGIGK